MSFKSSFEALEDAGGSWLGFEILIWILIWSLIFDTPMIWIWAFYLDFEGAKNIHVLYVLIWSFGGPWRFMTGVLQPYIDLDMVAGFWHTHDPNLGSLSWFWRCKEHPCPSSPHLGLWRMLEVPDWGSASWHWFGYGHWSLVHTHSQFWLSLFDFESAKNIHVLKSSFWALEDTGDSWPGLGIFIWIWIWSLVFDTPMFQITALYFDFESAKNIHVL